MLGALIVGELVSVSISEEAPLSLNMKQSNDSEKYGVKLFKNNML